MPILSILTTLAALAATTNPNIFAAFPHSLAHRQAPDSASIFRPESDTLLITVVYDNYQYEPGLRTGWGFAALVETRNHKILFDTGADAPTLLANMRSLDMDPASVDAVVLSHAHGDHTAGLDGLLAAGARPTVYLLSSFPADLKRRIAEAAPVVESGSGQSIAEGVMTTGQVSGPIPEEALIVQTAKGLVVITGCAHPGITRMVSVARTLGSDKVHLLLGGFHLRGKSDRELEAIVSELRGLGVERVAPSHCTGDAAIQRFEADYGEDFIQAGVGRVILIEG